MPANRKTTDAARTRTGRRHPLAAVALLALGLSVTGGAYAGAQQRHGATAETDAHVAADDRGGQEALPGELRHLPRPRRRRAPTTARASSASARPPSTSRSAPAACRCRCRVRRRSRSRRSSPTSRSSSSPPTSPRSAPAPTSPPTSLVDGERRRGQRRRAVPHQLRDVPQRGRRGRRAHRGQVRSRAHGRRARCTSTRRWSPARRTCRSSTT